MGLELPSSSSFQLDTSALQGSWSFPCMQVGSNQLQQLGLNNVPVNAQSANGTYTFNGSNLTVDAQYFSDTSCQNPLSSTQTSGTADFGDFDDGENDGAKTIDFKVKLPDGTIIVEKDIYKVANGVLIFGDPVGPSDHGRPAIFPQAGHHSSSYKPFPAPHAPQAQTAAPDFQK